MLRSDLCKGLVAMRMAHGVVVMNDFVRPDGDGRPGEGDRSAVWLFDAIKRQVAEASRLPMRLLTARNCPDLLAWVQARRAAADADRHWAATYEALPQDRELDDILLPHVLGRFVVGNEMPPYLLRILAAHGVPYLDIRVHPVRFLDDLLFAVRVSEAATRAAVLDMAVSEEIVLSSAGLVEAMCRYTSSCNLPPNTLLVIGQRTMDSTQIQGGAFFDARDCLPRIRAICESYRGLLLKPHPYGGNHSLLRTTAALPNFLAVTNDNIYRLLAQPEITGVLTVNSSSAYEAAYFGKRVHTLGALPAHIVWGGGAAQDESYISVGDALLSVDFWRVVLGAHADVGPVTGHRLPPKPNRLRIAHDNFWNFQEIDTDRIPRSAIMPALRSEGALAQPAR